MNEKNNRNNDKVVRGNSMLVIGIAVGTLLLAIVGATYAFFTVAVSGNNTATSVITKTAKLGIVFNDGAEITLNNIMPDDIRLTPPSTDGTRIFTVFNDSTLTMRYNILWTDVANTFDAGISDLKYTVSGISDDETTPGVPGQLLTPTMVPNANGTMIAAIDILPGETHTYTLQLQFPDTSSNQDAQQGKGFAGKIQISEPSL